MLHKVAILAVLGFAASATAQSQGATAGYTCPPNDLYVMPGDTAGSPLCTSTPPPSTDPNTGADVTPGPNEVFCQYSKGNTIADCPTNPYTGSTCWYNKTTGEVNSTKSDDTDESTAGSQYCAPAIPPSSKRLRARRLAHAHGVPMPATS